MKLAAASPKTLFIISPTDNTRALCQFFAAELAVFRHLTGNNIDIHIGSIGNELFRQRRLSKQMPALRHASSDHDLCHAGKSGKLRYLKRNVVPAGGFNLGSQLLCQTDMPPKPAPVLLVHFLGLGSFHIQRCKFPLKASAIRAAARIMVPLAGEEDRQTKICSP